MHNPAREPATSAAGAPRGVPRCMYILYSLIPFFATPPGILPTPKGARVQVRCAFHPVWQSELEGTRAGPRALLGVGRSRAELLKKYDVEPFCT